MVEVSDTTPILVIWEHTAVNPSVHDGLGSNSCRGSVFGDLEFGADSLIGLVLVFPESGLVNLVWDRVISLFVNILGFYLILQTRQLWDRRVRDLRARQFEAGRFEGLGLFNISPEEST